MIKEMVIKAYNFAKTRHEGQYRKYCSIPYFVHPKSVARIIETLTKDPEIVSAALLHDVVEDTETPLKEIETEFSLRVAQLVDELTNKKDELKELSKKEYLFKKFRTMSPDALLIKLADRLHNLMFLERDLGGNAYKDFIKYYYGETLFILTGFENDERIIPRLTKYHRVLLKKIWAVLEFLKVIHNLEDLCPQE